MSENPSTGGARIVLYRCPNPTNVLCPCGAVARRLRRLELEYRTERVPYRRSRRPEIEELTRQRRVPVLVDGEEVIHDSRRIVQYLEWRYRPKAREEGGDAPAAESPAGEVRRAAPQEAERAAPEETGSAAPRRARRAASPGLYNLKRWKRRKKRSS